MRRLFFPALTIALLALAVLFTAPLQAKNKPCGKLCAAAEKGDLKQIEKLLQAGESPNAADTGGNTPLHLAVLKNKEKAVALLLKKGANPGRKNKQGKTPLALAKSQTIQKILEAAIAQQASNEKDKNLEKTVEETLETVEEIDL